MKKIFLSFLLLLISFSFVFGAEEASDPCAISTISGNVADALDGCLSKTDLVKSPETGTGIIKGAVGKIVAQVALVLGFLAVAAIVYAGIMMVISAGDDEKIKKGKDLMKWAIIGFVGVVLAPTIIYFIVNFIYGL